MNVPQIALIYRETVAVLAEAFHDMDCHHCGATIKKGSEVFWVQWEDNSRPIYCKTCVKNLRA